MNQLFVFPLTRVKQVWRELNALGVFYSIILLTAAVALFVIFSLTQNSLQHTLIWHAGLLLICLFIHLNRNDHRFIFLNCSSPFYVYFIEYLIPVLIFTLISCFVSSTLLPLLVIIPLSGVAAIGSVKDISFKSFFPVAFTGRENFEWKAGLRRTGWLFSLFFIGAILSTPFPFVSIVLLWFMLLIVSSFYEYHESREMVESFELSENNFIHRKIRVHLVPFMLLTIAVTVISLFFHPGNWWVSLLFIVFAGINIGVFIVSKYAVWGPGERHSSIMLLNTLCMLGFFLPFLLPLPLILFIINYRKSIRTLKPLLNDYHS